MILTGLEIEKRLGTDIKIDPYDPKKLNPNSYNLTLHDELIVYKDNILDMAIDNQYKTVKIPSDGLLLVPGVLYLGRTVERTETINLVPMLEGRSSMGRLGLSVHVTAGFGDIGFKGYWTLEIHCIQPVIIYPFIEICQIYYHTIYGNHIPYVNGKYQNNKGIQTSQIFKELEGKIYGRDI